MLHRVLLWTAQHVVKVKGQADIIWLTSGEVTKCGVEFRQWITELGVRV